MQSYNVEVSYVELGGCNNVLYKLIFSYKHLKTFECIFFISFPLLQVQSINQIFTSVPKRVPFTFRFAFFKSGQTVYFEFTLFKFRFFQEGNRRALQMSQPSPRFYFSFFFFFVYSKMLHVRLYVRI